MRKDFTKVFNEPGRVGGWGSSKKRIRVRQCRDLDSLPRTESSHRRTRERTQNYAPLRRYFLCQIGRPWTHVYSEISFSARSGDGATSKFLEAIDWLVDTKVVLIDGQPFGSRWGQRYPLSRDFYVHPETGILMQAPPQPKRRYTPKPPEFENYPIDAHHKIVKIKDVWFVVTFADVPTTPFEEAHYDLVNGAFVMRGHRNIPHTLRAAWGSDIFAVSKRSANSREIKRYVKSPSALDAAVA